MTHHQTPPSVPTDEMVERIAAIIDPRAFVGTPEEIHMYCSPVAVEYVQAHALARAREIVAALAAMPGRVAHGCKCQGCGNLYRVDITVPDELWNRIRPEGKPEGAGLLCGHCIVSRVEALGEFAALPASPGSGWRPIETAPKDGTIIDVWLGDAELADIDFYCTPGTRRSCGWSWRDGKFRPLGGLSVTMPTFVQPTHWQPLPTPPTAQEGK